MKNMKSIVIRCGVGVVILALGAGLATYGPNWYRIAQYQPQEGDVLVQDISPCGRLLRTVKGVTQSEWCHCGVVVKKDGQWQVCEAVGKAVRYTPLRAFLWRGDTVHFAAYRLREPFHVNIPKFIESLQPYVGRPYDMQFELDDEKIYCSELVYKAYRDATGEELGSVQTFGDLNWEPFHDELAHYHGNHDLPLAREVVTPVSLTHSPQLIRVF